jgi:hypothetical protein
MARDPGLLWRYKKKLWVRSLRRANGCMAIPRLLELPRRYSVFRLSPDVSPGDQSPSPSPSKGSGLLDLGSGPSRNPAKPLRRDRHGAVEPVAWASGRPAHPHLPGRLVKWRGPAWKDWAAGFLRVRWR